LGLSFKPNTDDIRETPAIFGLENLLARGAKVRGYDPAAMDNARRIRPEAVYCNAPYEVAEDADLLVILTEWNQFRALEFGRLRQLLREPQILDLRNLYEPGRVADAGLRYSSLGRADAIPAATVPGVKAS
ncbi:MAG: UDP-glucose 6-dehydrogenase, partial [Holophagales bacterium]|nr:UDP-glucose 6-dehydrogenase [Holophagales bacterium]